MMEAVDPWAIFGVIALSSLLSLGGGNGQIPVIQGQWVEPGILPPGLFSFALGITYLAPGPKAGFIAGIGYYLAGFPGAVAAVLGLVVPTTLGAVGVSYAATKMERVVRRLAPSAGYVLAALIAAAAWGTAVPMGLAGVELIGVAVVAGLVVWRRVDPVWLILAAVVVGAAASATSILSGP